MSVTVSSALLATANAAADGAADGAKNAAFCGAISTGIGSDCRLVARRDGVVVLDVRLPGALTVSSAGLDVPTQYNALYTLSAADIDTGTWTLRIEKFSDASVYLTGSLGRSGTDFLLSDDLDPAKGFAIAGLTLRSPSLDTSTRRWNPGHFYIVTDDMTRSSLILSSRRSLVQSHPYMNYMGQFWWHMHETSKGVYDFSRILQALDTAAADGKKMNIMPCNRSFHGTSRGACVPQYLSSEGYTYTYSGAGENFVGPKLWLPYVSDRWSEYLTRLIRAVDNHEAANLIYSEEGTMSGAWLQPGWTWQAANDQILAQCAVAAAECKRTLFHQERAWTNEADTNLTEQYRMCDTIVRTNKLGVGVNDIVTDSYTAQASPYGKFIYSRYAGEAYFAGGCEWSGHFGSRNASQVIDFAVDTLGINFMHWVEVIGNYGQTFDTNAALAAITAKSGKINATKPSNVT